MNKVYTIGRDPSCDIVITDSTDVVSRVHASLKVKGRGKYILVDQGRNGTYVNGIKMSPNEEIPVTRKDLISFAHVADLDWGCVPREKPTGLAWGLVSVVALAAAGTVLYFLLRPAPQPEATPVPESIPTQIIRDTIIKKDTVRDAVFIPKETPRPAPAPRKEGQPKPKKEEPAGKGAAEEEVIDAIY